MDTISLSSWELVCHRLTIKDVVSLFQTCRDLRSLSKKQSLWSALLQRDYPKHYRFASDCFHSWYYQDLHHFGAYWNISGIMTLHPGKILFAAPEQISGTDRFYVFTSTERGFCQHEMLRFPGEQWVRIVRAQELGLHEIEQLTCKSTFSQSGREYIFIRGKKLGNLPKYYALQSIVRWDGSCFDSILGYLHKHFWIEQITMHSGAWNDEIFWIKARLREDCLLGVPESDLDEEWRHDLIQISATLASSITEYKVYKTQGHFEDYKVGEMHSTGPNPISFRCINREEIPLW